MDLSRIYNKWYDSRGPRRSFPLRGSHFRGLPIFQILIKILSVLILLINVPIRTLEIASFFNKKKSAGTWLF